MSALFNLQSLLTVVLLLICTCAYVRSLFPSLVDRNKVGANVIAMPGLDHNCFILCPMGLFLSGAWIFILVNTEFGTFLTSIHWVRGMKWAEPEGYHSPVPSAVLMLLGIFWKCARIGERISPYVAGSCIIMAVSILFWS